MATATSMPIPAPPDANMTMSATPNASHAQWPHPIRINDIRSAADRLGRDTAHWKEDYSVKQHLAAVTHPNGEGTQRGLPILTSKMAHLP